MSVVIGIDVGGSTTKIVGFDCSNGDMRLINSAVRARHRPDDRAVRRVR